MSSYCFTPNKMPHRELPWDAVCGVHQVLVYNLKGKRLENHEDKLSFLLHYWPIKKIKQNTCNTDCRGSGSQVEHTALSKSLDSHVFTWGNGSYLSIYLSVMIRPQTSALSTRRVPGPSLLHLGSLSSVFCHKTEREEEWVWWSCLQGLMWSGDTILLCCTWQKPIIWLVRLLK